MAAVLSAGADAVISYQSAGELWGVRRSGSAAIDVTVPRKLRPRPGLRFHLSSLPDDERDTVDGISVTTVGRALIDLAGILSPSALQRVVERVEALQLTHEVPVSELLLRYPQRPGTGKLRAVLAQPLVNPTRSELENRFQEFLHDAGFRRPEINALVNVRGTWLELDCIWRRQKLVVELDGYETHGTRAAFARDRRRDRLLEAAGFTVIRVTWWDLDPGEHRAALERDLHLLLQRAAA